MELLKTVSGVLKKFAGITTILAILSETFIFLSNKIDEAITKEGGKNDSQA